MSEPEREADRPVMSPESVEAAVGTAPSQVTYQHLDRSNMGYPLTKGCLWGMFTHTLASRWAQFNSDYDKTINTFNNYSTIFQTQSGTDGSTDPDGIEQTVYKGELAKERLPSPRFMSEARASQLFPQILVISDGTFSRTLTEQLINNFPPVEGLVADAQWTQTLIGV